MAKPKEKSEVEHLRGLVRELKSENKHLKKQLGRAKKREAASFSDDEEHDDEDVVMDPDTPINNRFQCKSCNGTVEIFDLVVKNLLICSTCGCRRTEAK